MTNDSEERVVLYETPDGVIVQNSRWGRQEIRVYKGEGEIVCLKVSNQKPGQKEFHQTLKLDRDMARHLSAVLWEVSKESQGRGS